MQVTRIAMNNFIFFFNDTATTEIYTLSLHDALPICDPEHLGVIARTSVMHYKNDRAPMDRIARELGVQDRKSTRLNSSHDQISYAVFCLKKKTAQTPSSPSHIRPTPPITPGSGTSES